MDKKDEQKIILNNLLLTRDMHIDTHFMAIIKQRYTLTYGMIEEIEYEKKPTEKNALFLRYIRQKGPYAFEDFIIALMETNQEHLAMALSPELVDRWKQANPNKVSSVFDWPPKIRGSPHISSPRKPQSPRQGTPTRTPTRKSASVLNNSSIDENDEAYIQINLQAVQPELAQKILLNPKENYRMSSSPRGRVIILNNEQFKEKSERIGSEFDAVNLKELFEGLGFTVVQWPNYTADKIKKEIFKERHHPEHKTADAFVFVALSHGNRGVIYGTDDEPVNIENDIMAKFDGKNCQTLVGKPKLFFIQACQGGQVTKGVLQSDSGEEEDAVKENSLIDDDQFPELRKVHEKADMLLMLATTPGYKAWRDMAKGTWFIRDLIVTIYQNAHLKPLADILQKVTDKLNSREGVTNNKQISQTTSTLRKCFYFLPLYYEPV